MRPRTKRERLVAELSSKLPAITEAQIKWGKKHCFTHNAYRCKDEMWCSECGRMWVDVTSQKEGYIRCPYCGERLEIKSSRKKKLCQYEYMTIVTAVAGFQVLRHVEIGKHKGIKMGEIFYHSTEVCQQWITEDGKETVMAMPMNMGKNSWIYTQPISIKNSINYYGYNCYDINGYVYPKVKLLPILRRNGLRTSFHGVTPARLIRAILGESRYAEMLLKTKQYSLLNFYMHRGGLSHPWAVNICNRNGYIIKDGSMYDDYLHLLDYFHLDTHNAHYVCPKDLKKAHDELLKRKQKIEAKQRVENERKARAEKMGRMKLDIQSFIRRIQPFIGMEIKDKTIVIRPLESVTQFYQEGKTMHHCVYSNEYYKKSNSLILSSTVGGKRMETVEVSLRTFRIVQSRAVCNGVSPYHARIINLVNQNMNLIKERKKQWKEQPNSTP
ncbi:PcfJ domain-containing protein [uncultured Phocaeicola sp.]|uniref:PcfJ domain-containing protein n=1 Tax=uncultured Phocaeicola sp. TaxID=990718 RepID=UPI002592A9E1|nr:PcfJ domain-containing protein [uncultured Phocaeicola sp.]